MQNVYLQCELLEKWGITDFTIRVNTLGSDKDKNNVQTGLLKELDQFSDMLSLEQKIGKFKRTKISRFKR